MVVRWSSIFSMRPFASVIVFIDSALRSSYTLTPATSLIIARRWSSLALVSLSTLPCGTMLYGLARERPHVSRSEMTSLRVASLRSM